MSIVCSGSSGESAPGFIIKSFSGREYSSCVSVVQHLGSVEEAGGAMMACEERKDN